MAAIVVTTPYRPSEQLERRSREVARDLGAQWVERRGMSLPKLQSRYLPEHLVVVGSDGIHWHAGGAGFQPFFFHPGLSVVRIKRLMDGQRDAMLEACGFEPGDEVLDCTAGLASDSIVFSYAGQGHSAVTALESRFPLYYVVSRGLQTYDADLPALNDAMRRIRSVHADHAAYMSALPDRSVDIVYFDPMFREPVRASSGISPLRFLADERTVSHTSVREAVRIARKCVVLKELRESGEFERLGFEPDTRNQSKIAYGVIRI
ncbi:class I SAM-dependent methyltransferase [Paenibacillus alkalitolerans]|uniref:class I SAM-dependent methyltransferase n=1 Tax=Paenibacillus alkalitolerans TaxID=2799335 RepID=UPI001F228906|nr:class I SAM-dependent methyltransferase [Paenibacillus alkalitolerans]